MCELDQLSSMTAVNRRQFTRMGVTLGAGATIAACSTTAEAEGGLSERMVTFAAAGGTMDGLFVHPAGKKSPAVILWPDIAGLRPAKRKDAEMIFIVGDHVEPIAGAHQSACRAHMGGPAGMRGLVQRQPAQAR